MPRVLTAILNHRTPAQALQCLASVRQSTQRDQVVRLIDNGSGDGSAAQLMQAQPTTVVVQAHENLGYAGGNNLALREALELGCEFTWIINPDCLVEPDTLDLLLREADRHPEAGVLGPRIVHGGTHPATIQSDGGLVGADGSSSHRHTGEPVGATPAEASAVDFVSGSCLLIRSATAAEVGLLPEEYFLYFEETDYALRGAELGWTARVEPRAVAHHFRVSATRLPTPAYVYYYVRGQAMFGRRWRDLNPTTTVSRLRPWHDGWRARVLEHAPDWLSTFDELVAWAVADAAAGAVGRRDDVHEVASP